MGGDHKKMNDYRGQEKSNRRLEVSQMHCIELTILKMHNVRSRLIESRLWV